MSDGGNGLVIAVYFVFGIGLLAFYGYAWWAGHRAERDESEGPEPEADPE